MASLLAKIFDFQANIPVSSLDPLDAEFQQVIDVLNGTATGTKLLVKASDASDPVIESDQLGAGPLAEWKQNGTLKTSIANTGQIVSAVATGTAPFSVASTTVVTNLNADTVDGIQGANIAKLDTHKTAFSFSFGIADPSTPTVGVPIPGQVAWICPPSTSLTITKLSVRWDLGSHTSGGSVVFNVEKRTAASSWATNTVIGDLTLDDAHDDFFVVYENDIADELMTAGDTLIVYIASRSGTVSERNISIAVIGTQKFTT